MKASDSQSASHSSPQPRGVKKQQFFPFVTPGEIKCPAMNQQKKTLEIPEAIKELKEYQKKVRDLERKVQEVYRCMEKDSLSLELADEWEKAMVLVHSIMNFQKDSSAFEKIHHWLREAEPQIRQKLNQYALREINELGQRLREQQLFLHGQMPEFRVGFFWIQVDQKKLQTTIWYGPKQERQETCSLSAKAILDCLKKCRKNLGSQIPAEDFFEKLREQYRKLAPQAGERVPLIRLLPYMALAVQDNRFYIDPRAKYYKEYGRADFSFDLYRIRSLFGKFQLATAPRAKTKNKRDFLWIPQDDKGKGTFFATISVGD